MQCYLLNRAHVLANSRYFTTGILNINLDCNSSMLSTLFRAFNNSNLSQHTRYSTESNFSPTNTGQGVFPCSGQAHVSNTFLRTISLFYCKGFGWGGFWFVFKLDVGKLFHREYNNKISDFLHCSHYWQLFHQVFSFDKDISLGSWTIHFYPSNHSNRFTSYWFPVMFSSHCPHFFLLLNCPPSCLKTWHSWSPHLKGPNLKKLFAGYIDTWRDVGILT